MLIYYYRTVLQSACQVLCLSILGNCLFGNYPKVDCSGIGKDPSVCYFGTATSCCKSCNDVSTGVSGMFYLFRINIVIKLLNLLLFLIPVGRIYHSCSVKQCISSNCSFPKGVNTVTARVCVTPSLPGHLVTPQTQTSNAVTHVPHSKRKFHVGTLPLGFLMF